MVSDAEAFAWTSAKALRLQVMFRHVAQEALNCRRWLPKAFGLKLFHNFSLPIPNNSLLFGNLGELMFEECLAFRIHSDHVYNHDVLKKIKPRTFTSTPQEMWTGDAQPRTGKSAQKKKAASPEPKDDECQEQQDEETAHAKEGAEEETPRESDPIVDPEEHEHGGKLIKRPSSKDVKKRPATKEQAKGSAAASTEPPPPKRLRSKQSTEQSQEATAPATSAVKLIQIKKSKSAMNLDKNAGNMEQLPQASKKKRTAAKTKAAPKEMSRAAPKPVAKPAPQPTPQQRSDGLASFDLMAET